MAGPGQRVNPDRSINQGRASIEGDLRAGLNGFMKGSRHELTVNHVCSLDERTAVVDGMAMAGQAGSAACVVWVWPVVTVQLASRFSASSDGLPGSAV